MLIGSATRPGVTYEVNLAQGTCTCPSYTLGRRRPCKHLVEVARALESATKSYAKAEQMLLSGYRMDDPDLQDVLDDAAAGYFDGTR